MSRKLFETEKEERIVTVSLDSRLDSSSVFYVVYVMEKRLTRLTLSEKFPERTFKGYRFVATEESIQVNDTVLTLGMNSYEGLDLFVVSSSKATTHYMMFPRHGFMIANQENAGVRIQGDTLVNIEPDYVTIHVGQFPVYLNDGLKFLRIDSEVMGIKDFEVGFQIFTPDFCLERRINQWKFTAFNDALAFDTSKYFEMDEVLETPEDFPEYRRSPRLLLEPPTENITVDKIPSAPQPRKNSILKTLVPPLGMIAAGVLMSTVSGRNPAFMMVSVIGSIGTTVGSVSAYFNDKKEVKRKTIEREEDYDAYFMGKEAHLVLQYQEEKKVLEYQHPSPEALVELVQQYDSRLYERMTNNKDFLEVTLGLSEQPTNLKLSYPNDEQEKDPEMLRVQKVMKHYEKQRDVPTKLELMTQTIGFVGTYDVLKTQVANLLFQTAFFQSYRDVNFITLVPEKEYDEDWDSTRFLPHYKLQELSNLRGIVHNAQSRDMVLNSFQRKLAERKQALEQAGREKPQFSPHYILTIFDDSYLAGHGINEYLVKDTSELGLTVIYCREDQRLLPETTTAVVEYFNNTAGQIINDHNLHVSTPFRPYREVPEMETAIRQMANLNHVEVEKNAIPKAVTFLEMYKVKKVEELGIGQRWKDSNASKSLAVPIGLRGKDDTEILNLHEKADGPHGIFGGTTGAGKSEMAQSLLLSLAVNFPPEDVSFLIIDFKGGGMSALFRKLPHLTGEITNLDGAGVQRAITAFQAELDKRQRFFDQFGVNNLNDYTKLYREGKETHDPKYPTEPLPHLIIVGDETAELKAKAAEFLDVLVSGARVGRSLGLHQFLGTQSPAGVISDQIWDNSKFKLSLRMADDEASKSILKTPDAAHLSTSLPGRAYLKVGTSERYELFQSAYSAADYNPNGEDDEVEVRDSRIWEIDDLGQTQLATKDLSESGEPKKKKSAEKYTELDAVVDYIAELVEKNNSKIPAKPWLPLLEESIITPEVENKGTRNTKIPLGLMDIPSQQTQEIYEYNIQEASHTAIFSSPGYGKSTTIQTIVMNLARQNSPEQVQFNLLDFGSNGLLPLKDLPHVADIVSLEEDEKLGKMLNRILQTVKERSELFKENDVVSLTQYQAKTGIELPLIVNLFDGYDAVREHPAGELIETVLNTVIRDGAGLGVYAIMTANRVGAFFGKTLANVKTNIVLYLSDKQETMEALGQRPMEATDVSGRGQLVYNALPTQIQIYLCTDATDVLAYGSWFESQSALLSQKYQDNLPKPIPMVASQLAFDMLPEEISLVDSLSQHKLFLGLSQATTEKCEWNLNEEIALLIAVDGEEQSQVFFQLLLKQIEQNENLQKILIDINGDFPAYKDFFDAYYDEDLSELKSEVLGALSETSESKKLYFFADIESAFSEMKFTEADMKQLLKKGSHSNNFIFQAYNSYISNAYDNVIKLLRSRVNMGLFGVRLAEQKLVPVAKLVSGEDYLQENELYVYVGRKYDKLRLPMEME